MNINIPHGTSSRNDFLISGNLLRKHCYPDVGFAELPVVFATQSAGFGELPVLFAIQSVDFAELPVFFAIPSVGFAELPVLFAIPLAGFAEFPAVFAKLPVDFAILGHLRAVISRHLSHKSPTGSNKPFHPWCRGC